MKWLVILLTVIAGLVALIGLILFFTFAFMAAASPGADPDLNNLAGISMLMGVFGAFGTVVGCLIGDAHGWWRR